MLKSIDITGHVPRLLPLPTGLSLSSPDTVRPRRPRPLMPLLSQKPTRPLNTQPEGSSWPIQRISAPFSGPGGCSPTFAKCSATGERFNQFGEDPDGYIGYAPDDRMDAIFTRKDRITPADAVPTEEEGVQLLGTMVAYAGTFTLEAEKVTHHIDISWKQAWTGTDQVRFYTLDGNMLSITTAPYKSYFDAKEGRSILVGKRVRSGERCAVSSEREPSLL